MNQSNEEGRAVSDAVPITDEQLAEWEALAEGATEGPWHVDDVLGWSIDGASGQYVAEVSGRHDPNAEFIAASREAVPALVAEVRRLREGIARLADEYDEAASRSATRGWRTQAVSLSRHSAELRALLEDQ